VSKDDPTENETETREHLTPGDRPSRVRRRRNESGASDDARDSAVKVDTACVAEPATIETRSSESVETEVSASESSIEVAPVKSMDNDAVVVTAASAQADSRSAESVEDQSEGASNRSAVETGRSEVESNQAEAGPKAKVRSFPTVPGVYLMKDAQGRVIYVGKAKNLRARASSYFQKTAALDRRVADWVDEIADIDFLVADGEVDALLMEARLVKDIQPKHNVDLKDDKSFPYLQITTNEDFPRVNFTREPRDRGVKLYGPFPRAKSLRGAIQVLQRIFKFRTCSLDIEEDDPRWRWFRPCLLHSINQCTAPCNLSVDRDSYRNDIRRLKLFLEGKKDAVIEEMEAEMRESSRSLLFEKAARLRDEIKALRNLSLRGDLAKHAQPEVFYVDPARGLAGLKKVLHLDSKPRTIEGVDIAHLGGTETVGSLVTFIDGLPFKPGYRRYKIKTVPGVDDFASIREVVDRRVRGIQERDEPMPDIMLIDGGKGQLSAARSALDALKVVNTTLISLAKREEEIFVVGRSEPIVLRRRSFALRLLQYVRDEAHRFAQHYHHILRRKRTFDEETE
jgi:excinuclease ABC subunit C